MALALALCSLWVMAAAPPAPRSCAAEIGAKAAARLVARCRNVSPATHPPCNAANACALIEAEIVRSCAFLKDETPPVADCQPHPKG